MEEELRWRIIIFRYYYEDREYWLDKSPVLYWTEVFAEKDSGG